MGASPVLEGGGVSLCDKQVVFGNLGPRKARFMRIRVVNESAGNYIVKRTVL
jgi:hypothetical protein